MKKKKRIPDSDKLPYKLVSKYLRCRCQCLDEDGYRCFRKARYAVAIHEMSEFGGRWVIVHLCKNHLSGKSCEIDQIKQLEASNDSP